MRGLRAADHQARRARPARTCRTRRRSTRSARRPGPSADHIFGVDQLGRDVFARVLYGARVSLEVAIVATALSVVDRRRRSGMIAGFYRGWVDTVHLAPDRRAARVPDPAARRSASRRPARSATAASAGSIKPGLDGRDLRDRVRELDLHRAHHPRPGAVAAREGVRRRRALAGRLEPADHLPRDPAEPGRADHRLQHAGHPAEHPVRGGAVVPRASGSSRRTRAGAQMLADATSIFDTAWWYMVFPGAALLLTVLAFNLLGDGLHDALNPTGREMTAQR